MYKHVSTNVPIIIIWRHHCFFSYRHFSLLSSVVVQMFLISYILDSCKFLWIFSIIQIYIDRQDKRDNINCRPEEFFFTALCVIQMKKKLKKKNKPFDQFWINWFLVIMHILLHLFWRNKQNKKKFEFYSLNTEKNIITTNRFEHKMSVCLRVLFCLLFSGVERSIQIIIWLSLTVVFFILSLSRSLKDNQSSYA